jgi:hypothetical protein
MPQPSACDCVLCDIEVRLLASLLPEGATLAELPVSGQLQLFPSVPAFVQLLRASPAAARSDELLRALVRLRESRPACVEGLLILAFVPMLHRSIRRVAEYQPALAEEDITQQALSFLLEFLRSQELQKRESHFAFAISRAVKRQLFEWGRREGRKLAVLEQSGDGLPLLAVEEPFEQFAQLGHFLHRCVARGTLTNAELDLLIHFKIEGSKGEDFESGNGRSSNALRQRLKRLLSKLRRLAEPSRRIRGSRNEPCLEGRTNRRSTSVAKKICSFSATHFSR